MQGALSTVWWPRRMACLALWLFGIVLAAGSLPARATDYTQTLTSANAVTIVDGQTRNGRVRLPYHWDREHDGQPGSAAFVISFALAAVPDEPWGIYIARVGSTFELRLNGELLQRSGSIELSDRHDYSKTPRFIPVPASLLRAGDNLIDIRIRADTGRRAGLSAVMVGPADVVRDGEFAHAYAWRFTGSVLLASFSLIVAAIAFALWLTQIDIAAASGRRREGVFLWAALAEFAWALRVADGAISSPPLPWLHWAMLMTASYSGWVVSSMLFCHHVAGWQRNRGLRWTHWAMAIFFVGSIVATWMSITRAEPEWLTWWLAVEIAGVLAYVGGFVLATFRRPNRARVLLSSVAVLTVLVGLRDWLVIRMTDSYGDTTWVRYTSVFFGIALLAILLSRFRAASTQARDMLDTMAARVENRENELAVTYGQLEQVARTQAATRERERILRDMHDGVGSHISAAIRQLQSGRSSSAELLRTLRDSLDQLKLSIDSIYLPPGDVSALLAALRYRLGPRIESTGIALDWAVDELERRTRLDSQAMRQLQFLLFEAISNVMQHAQATVLRIEAVMDAGSVRLRVIDNGRGFETGQAPRALAERAAACDATLRIESRPGRTVVELVLR